MHHLFLQNTSLINFIFYLFSSFAEMEETKLQKIIKLDDFFLEAILGIGSFGKVKLARNKKTKTLSCVKVMKKAEIVSEKQTDHIINEFKIMNTIQHPFIVNFQGIAQNKKHLYLFMQLVQGGEMFSHLREEGVFEPEKAAFYGAQVVLIFQYLHSKDIIYRDLKPENILIESNGYIKLTDFGFAKKIQNRTFTLCGTPEYLAPEILLSQGHGKPVDWWTLGILLYEMLAGMDPFGDKDAMSIYHNILRCKVKFPRDFDPDAKSLVKHLLVPDLSKRYGNLKGGKCQTIKGIDDIKNHRYFYSINYNSLLQKKISPPYKPILKSQEDLSHFGVYEDSNSKVQEVSNDQDPFLHTL